jgi:hypothetical protein
MCSNDFTTIVMNETMFVQDEPVVTLDPYSDNTVNVMYDPNSYNI